MRRALRLHRLGQRILILGGFDMAEILILKNGSMIARTTDSTATAEDVFSVQVISAAPEYPTESPGRGKIWQLQYDAETQTVAWVAVARPLSAEERLDSLEGQMQQITLAWVAGEAVAVGDKRYYNGVWYVCIQAHTTQADWTPDVTQALWNVVSAS